MSDPTKLDLAAAELQAAEARQRLSGTVSQLQARLDPKLLAECTFPLTGVGCVSRIYADRGVFLLDASGVVRVRELHGITWEELEAAHPGVRFEKLED